MSKDNIKITINRKKCISCGLCTTIAPKTFEQGEDLIATVKKEPWDKPKKIIDAAKSCPVKAITVSN